jgi:hypothetical protein
VTIEQDPVERDHDAGTSESTRVVRATSEMGRTQATAATSDQRSAAIITAELPAYRAAPQTTSGPRSRYADPRPPGRSRRRDPAPIVVRAFVWILAFICLVSVVTLVTAQVHPSWLAFARDTHESVLTSPTRGGGSPVPVNTGAMHLVSNNASLAVYDVPASTFKIEVAPVARCFVEIDAPPLSKHALVATVITPGKAPTAFSVSRSVSVVVDASAKSIAIVSGATTYGTIPTPSLGKHYVFDAEKG